MGKIVSINISKDKHSKKQGIKYADVIKNFGLEGDAHAGDTFRQVSLLSVDSISKIKDKLPDIKFGDFAENITTSGIDLSKLGVGERLKIGAGVVLEITQIGKHCQGNKCEIYQKVGDCVMPKEGIFTKVICGGKIRLGDEIKLYDNGRNNNGKR